MLRQFCQLCIFVKLKYAAYLEFNLIFVMWLLHMLTMSLHCIQLSSSYYAYSVGISDTNGASAHNTTEKLKSNNNNGISTLQQFFNEDERKVT